MNRDEFKQVRIGDVIASTWGAMRVTEADTSSGVLTLRGFRLSDGERGCAAHADAWHMAKDQEADIQTHQTAAEKHAAWIASLKPGDEVEEAYDHNRRRNVLRVEQLGPRWRVFYSDERGLPDGWDWGVDVRPIQAPQPAREVGCDYYVSTDDTVNGQAKWERADVQYRSELEAEVEREDRVPFSLPDSPITMRQSDWRAMIRRAENAEVEVWKRDAIIAQLTQQLRDAMQPGPQVVPKRDDMGLLTVRPMTRIGG